MFYTMKKAAQCAVVVKAHASIPVIVSVFGSVARLGIGRDVDLLVEVPPAMLDKYLERIRGDNRMDPFLKRPHEPNDMLWDYYTPGEHRTISVLKFLGTKDEVYEQLRDVIPIRKLDMICVPSDWRDREGVSRGRLDACVRQHDSRFFEKLEKTAKLAA